MTTKAARIFIAWVSATVLISPLPGAAQSENPLTPAVRVNNAVATQYDLDQRVNFLRLLNLPGDPEQVATDGLIDDLLRVEAAKTLGINVTDEQVQAGMAEFAGRAELGVDEFIQGIEQAGIDVRTFRDFVRAGLLWNAVVRARFAPRAQIGEAEIDRAIALASQSRGGVRVLLSEIVLPAPEGQEAAARLQAEEIRRLTSVRDFENAASTFSAAPSRTQGGRIDWLSIGNLPPALRVQLLTLSPGQITAPVELPGAIAIFQLRAIEDTVAPGAETLSVDYAVYHIPGGGDAPAQAQDIRNRVDTCDDLYGVAQGRPEEALERNILPLAEVPADIAVELARLDENESSAALTRSGPDGETLMFLMLCSRVTEQIEDVSREEIRSQLVNQRLTSLADSYLAELRADATIVFP